jgi:hypothetical protein
LKTIKKLAQAFRRTTEGMKRFVKGMQLLARIPDDKFEAKIAELCADPQEPQEQSQKEPQESEEPKENAEPQEEALRYKQSITVVTLFFAALLGFGLNHILETEHTEPDRSVIAHHRWGFFFVAVFIFLRYLTGSANHLWLEYVKYPRVPRTRFGLNQDDILFTWDLAWLTLFGCFGVAMCYSKNENTFFFLTALLLSAALIWSLSDVFFRWLEWRSEIGDWAPTWIVLNLFQLSAVIWVWKPCWVLLSIFLQPWQLSAVIWVWKAWGAPLLSQPWLLLPQWLPPWCVIAWSVGPVDRAVSYRLVDLAIISALTLAVDFYAQLRQLAK